MSLERINLIKKILKLKKILKKIFKLKKISIKISLSKSRNKIRLKKIKNRKSLKKVKNKISLRLIQNKTSQKQIQKITYKLIIQNKIMHPKTCKQTRHKNRTFLATLFKILMNPKANNKTSTTQQSRTTPYKKPST